MTIQIRKYISIGFAVMAIAVLFGAFGAHALKPRITPHYLDVFETASRYHFIHALGLIISMYILRDYSVKRLRVLFALFLTGIILFSGSLYILSVADLMGMPQLKFMGAITPIGGVLFVAAWVYAALTIRKQ